MKHPRSDGPQIRFLRPSDLESADLEPVRSKLAGTVGGRRAHTYVAETVAGTLAGYATVDPQPGQVIRLDIDADDAQVAGALRARAVGPYTDCVVNENGRTFEPAGPLAVKTVSLSRPWSELVVGGAKSVENRTWRTKWRGPIVIHAAQSTARWAGDFCAANGLTVPPPLADSPTGYLGVGRLVGVDCHDNACGGRCSPWAMEGSWHWRIVDCRRFADPIPGPGQRSLWQPPTAVLAAARGVL